MMTLPKPQTCSLDLLTAVLEERKGGRHRVFFKGIADEWRERVQRYLDNGGSAQHVPTWPAIAGMKNTFINLYKSPAEGSAQGAVLDVLRDHELDLCPACGEAGKPNTLDHFLPKSSYPEFAVTPANLFPMCDACQGAKLEKTGDATTPRYFIHPYFDTFTIPQIVSLKVHAPFATPTFDLTPHPDLQAAEAVLVGTHLRELEIIQRYVTFFKNEHRRLLRSVTTMRASGQDVVATLESFAQKAADPSPNSWENIFYRGVLDDVAAMNYLLNAPLPALP